MQNHYYQLVSLIMKLSKVAEVMQTNAVPLRILLRSISANPLCFLSPRAVKSPKAQKNNICIEVRIQTCIPPSYDRIVSYPSLCEPLSPSPFFIFYFFFAKKALWLFESASLLPSLHILKRSIMNQSPLPNLLPAGGFPAQQRTVSKSPESIDFVIPQAMPCHAMSCHAMSCHAIALL